nr:hypothetical protein [Kofleriaceae bacterium]
MTRVPRRPRARRCDDVTPDAQERVVCHELWLDDGSGAPPPESSPRGTGEHAIVRIEELR